MKFRFDTSTHEGKADVMKEYARNPDGILCIQKNNTLDAWGHTSYPGWNWEKWNYNYPIETKLIPWTLNTVPNKVPGGLWVRGKPDTAESLVIGFSKEGVTLEGFLWTYQELFTNYVLGYIDGTNLVEVVTTVSK